MLHRIIAETFVRNPENKPEINHKDGDKRNNRADNLEWVTRRENDAHARNTGLMRTARGSQKVKSAKLDEKKVAKIKSHIRNKTTTQRNLAKQFGVTESLISMIKSGGIWAHVVAELEEAEP